MCRHSSRVAFELLMRKRWDATPADRVNPAPLSEDLSRIDQEPTEAEGRPGISRSDRRQPVGASGGRA